jgi:hypothetical protein
VALSRFQRALGRTSLHIPFEQDTKTRAAEPAAASKNLQEARDG